MRSNPALSASHAASDPGFARAQRALLRQSRQQQGTLGEALRAQELYDQPEEPVNEAGDVVEPFHLRRELSEGYFDPAGTYIEYGRAEEQDAWLDSIDDRAQGTDRGTGWRLPYPNEPVSEPPPLTPRQLEPYLSRLLGLLQPGETVPAALRRLAGGGPVLEKFASKEEALRFFQERCRRAITRNSRSSQVGVGQHLQCNLAQAQEAAEVLFDHGHSGVYASTREELGQRLSAAQQAQRAPPAAAPPPHEAAAAAAEFGRPPQAAAAVEGQGGGTVAGGLSSAGGGRRHHHVPPAASPAAAAEPPVSPDIPSMPSGERTAATTRGGAGVAAAAHGFAAELPRDVLEERPASLAPPKATAAQEVELGLGLPAAAPTALELDSQHREAAAAATGDAAAGSGDELERLRLVQQLRQHHAAAVPEAQAALEAALYGSFADRLPQGQEAAAAAVLGYQAGEQLGRGARTGEAQRAAAAASASLPGPASRVPGQAAGGHTAASAAGNVALLAGMVQPAVRGSEAGAALGGRLISVGRMLGEQEAQEMHPKRGSTRVPAQQAQQRVAWDNEAANLAAPRRQSAEQ
ncbi:hypothetical protein CHLNCDRAFT_133077 [Chlorella variabilis]|uniref:GYF domain-containing protein n=1 Tax=Chlorella variabilis TaxID=554065 RepID=E1Z2A9_CHLVA|nr:hypothetical protein CHLNCDRAFT_133077 [Chlorella variabilis]EFN59969.1 hypothetical protein CHLNCDRAFT_133077 [Chlorella variabilis]|eukprot:XP_005852071.1 hypothetical protein CHLNCDRAFT_133077 [Chlorella variabilis]